MAKTHENKVRSWLLNRLAKFVISEKFDTAPMKELVGELKAISKEADLRLKNPNFPAKAGK